MLSRQRALELAEEFDLYAEQRAAGMPDAVVAMLQRDVKVEPTPGSRGDGRSTTVSFRVSYTGSDAQKVALVTNRLAQFYVDRNGAIRERQASRAADQLKQELDQTRARLDAQEKRVIDFTTVHAGTLPAQMSSITTKYSQLMQQLSTNTGEIAEAMSRRDTLETSLAALSSSTAAVDTADPTVRLAQAERELAALKMRETDASPAVRIKQAEIAGLKEQVAARAGASGTPARETSMAGTLRTQIADWNTRLEAFQKRNTEIQAEMAGYDKIIESAPIRNAEFERFSREAAQTRTQYDAMQARYQAALVGERAQQGAGREEFQVLDPAMPAESPSAPNRMVLLGIAALLALGLGVGRRAAGRRDRPVVPIRGRVEGVYPRAGARHDSSHRLAEGANTPPGDRGPRRGRPVGGARRGRRWGVSFCEAGGNRHPHAAPLGRRMALDKHLVTFSEPRSFEAEQYQWLRQQIERRSATKPLHVIAVTSAVVGDGKTFTALNLAGALARKEGRKVLVIDADLRRPAVMTRLGLDAPDEGLATALASTNGSLKNHVRKVDGTTLSVLPGEVVSGGTYELLTSPKFAALLKQARAEYDYVIIDTPPVLPLPDCGLLRDLVDGYLVVVSARSTPRKLVGEALSVLDPASVIGLVYNRDDRPIFGFYGSHYRQYFRAYAKSVSDTPSLLRVVVR